MNIAVNTRLMIKDRLEGIGWFTFETMKRIVAQHSEHNFIFLFDRKYSEEFVFASNVTPLVVQPPARHPVLWYTWFQVSVPLVMKKCKAGLFVSPDGFIPLNVNVPCVDVIHDINFVHRPDDLPKTYQWYLNHYFPKFAQKAKRIATVSEYSKQDISTSFSVSQSKIDVVYDGSNEVYLPVDEAEKTIIRNEFEAGNGYFIFIGALHPRKNVVRLLQAFDKFCENDSKGIKLLIVGEKMFLAEEIDKTFSTMKHQNRVMFAGRMNPERLRLILASSIALVFVPYFEGFGIPILEALNCDVPVISSNVTSMPEVAGNAALYVNPFSVEEITAAMHEISRNENLRNSLIEKGRIQKLKFSWNNTANLLWKTIEKAMQ